MKENDANEWARVNTLAKRLRDANKAVILVHHANKPSDSDLGREAGSTNQLTVIETQIRVTQVFEEKKIAKQNAAVWDGSYGDGNQIWPQLRERLLPGHRLLMVTEISFGKVREWTDLHDRVQWIGYAENEVTGARSIVSSSSTKQKVKKMAVNGLDVKTISEKIKRPIAVINNWLGLVGMTQGHTRVHELLGHRRARGGHAGVGLGVPCRD